MSARQVFVKTDCQRVERGLRQRHDSLPLQTLYAEENKVAKVENKVHRRPRDTLFVLVCRDKAETNTRGGRGGAGTDEKDNACGC